MSVPVIAFFNNKGGVGKTSLVYHLAWMFADLGAKVVAADLDPQANLTAAFVDDEDLESLWSSGNTIYGFIEPLIKGTGDVEYLHFLEALELLQQERLLLLPGDLRLSTFEDELSSQWPLCLDGRERAFRVESAFWRVMQRAAHDAEADVILVDLGPNLGSINRAGLIAADFVVIPLSPDLYSLQGLRNLGPTLKRWRRDWTDRLGRKPEMDLELPTGMIKPLGYVVLQHSVRLDRPVRAYEKWIDRIPGEYRESVLSESGDDKYTVQNDPHKLALLKHYRSLMPMAQEARKPMFHLKPADGAIGAHFQSAQEAYRDFKALAFAIADRAGLSLVSSQMSLLDSGARKPQ
jgi:chromosome partitioning protein